MRDGRGEWIDYSLAMFAVLGLFVAAGCTSDGPGLPEDPPEFVLDWGSSGSGDGDFMRPLDIAVDQAGFVYVADAQLGCVQKFTPTGEFVARWDIDALLGNDVPEYARFAPSALAADTAGVVFVGNVLGGGLARLDTRTRTGEVWNYGVADGGLDVAPDGSLFMSGSWDGSLLEPPDIPHIWKFTSRGDQLAVWDVTFPVGRPWRSGALARTPQGGILILDTESNRVQEYDANGAIVSDWGLVDPMGSNAMGLAMGPDGRVFVSRWAASVVEIYSRTGGLLSVLGSEGADPGQFGAPGGLAVDASGALYVTDYIHRRVQKFAYP